MEPIRVALIEDDLERISEFRRVIQTTGFPYILSVYENALAALVGMTKRNVPDMIVLNWFLPALVTDWFLPVLDAPGFAVEIRNVDGLENVAVAVLLPADWWPEDQEGAPGLSLFLKKPVDKNKMMKLLAFASTSADSRSSGSSV